MIKIIILAIICESVWQTLKMSWQKDKYLTTDNIGAILVGLVVSVSTNLDILSILGIDTSIPYIGMILTGILLSRGSNFVHDLLSKLQTTATSSISSVLATSTTQSVSSVDANAVVTKVEEAIK